VGASGECKPRAELGIHPGELPWVDIDDPPRLRELSNAVRQCIPISLASLSDRLGNIAVQLPVTVVIAQFKQIRATATFFVDLRWHPNATPRPLRAACELAFDKAISGYSSASVQAASTLLEDWLTESQTYLPDLATEEYRVMKYRVG
jgi:hypothetical protein